MPRLFRCCSVEWARRASSLVAGLIEPDSHVLPEGDADHPRRHRSGFMGTPIKRLDLGNRPRERLYQRGVEALSEVELLALILRTGTKGESALDLAAALLAEFGGVSGLAQAMPEELAGRAGVGPGKAASIVAALRLGTRIPGPAPLVIRWTEDAVALVRPELVNARRERVILVVCDAANRVRRIVKISEGSIDRSFVPARDILNAVLRNDGRAFLVAHNHPSSDPNPSDQDYRATEELAVAARAVGLRFLGHLIVTDRDWHLVTISRRAPG